MMMESSPDVLQSDHAHSLTNRARDCMSGVCEEVTFCQPHFVLTLCTGEDETVRVCVYMYMYMYMYMWAKYSTYMCM